MVSVNNDGTGTEEKLIQIGETQTFIVSGYNRTEVKAKAVDGGTGSSYATFEVTQTKSETGPQADKYRESIELADLSALRTPYVGNTGAVGKIIDALPPLGEMHRQKFFSIGDDYGTGLAPNTLTVYYEQDGRINDDYSITPRNAVLAFALIDNLKEVSMAACDAPSGDTLDKAAYHTRATFSRTDIADYLATVGLTWADFYNNWNVSVEKAFALIGDGRMDNPKIALYEYRYNTNPDVTTHIGEKLIPDETGWIELSDTIFIDVYRIPNGTVELRTYYAEAGSETTAHIMTDNKYSPPYKFSPVPGEEQSRGNSWRVADYFPGGFTGHIWAVTVDAIGREHYSDILNVIYEIGEATE
jgi:hypothetical protein